MINDGAGGSECKTISIFYVMFFSGQTFKAHRLVLAACSTHFENLFNNTPVNAPLNNQFFVILDGTRADDLQILLHFMYRGEAYLHQDRINSVLRTAEVLQVKGLSEGPRNIEINQNMHGSGSGGTASSRSWSPALSNPEGSPRHKIKKNDMDRDDSPLLRRPLSPAGIHGGNNGGGNGGLSPSYSYPPSTSRQPFPIFRDRGGVSSFGGRIIDSNAYSPPPQHRSKSPPPLGGPSSRGYPNSKFTPPPPPGGPNAHDQVHPKDEGREAAASAAAAHSSSSAVDMYEVRSAPSRGGGDSDRPPSNLSLIHI